MLSVSLGRVVFGVDLAWRRLLDPCSCSGPVRRAGLPIAAATLLPAPISAPTPAPAPATAPARLIAPLHPPDVASVESLVTGSNMLTALGRTFSFAGGTNRVAALSTS
jgi:hypothetical protein